MDLFFNEILINGPHMALALNRLQFLDGLQKNDNPKIPVSVPFYWCHFLTAEL